ncbi:MAG: MobF family relaxase [Bacteroidota bacterium]
MITQNDKRKIQEFTTATDWTVADWEDEKEVGSLLDILKAFNDDPQTAIEYWNKADQKANAAMRKNYSDRLAEIGFSTDKKISNTALLAYFDNDQTGEKITVRNVKNRRCGYDFTFNAPKSVSVVHAITKDEDILLAHRKATKLAMLEVEKNMQTQAWDGKEKYYEKTANLLYANFEHHLTRPVEYEINGEKQYIPDCHLHAHCYVINATWNADKSRFQAIEISNIKRSGIYYEALYQNHLAEELRKVGYAIERSRNGFEIAGVSQAIRDKYSNRTKEINLKAQEKGIIFDKEKDQLGARTRVKKNKSVSEEVMEAHWNDRLSAAEKQALYDLKDKARADEKEKENLSVEQALDRSLLHYMERKSAVPEKQVIGYALRLGIEQFSADDLQAEIDRRKEKDVISGEKNSDTYLTTKAAWLAEHRMKAFATHTRFQFEGLNPEYQPKQDFLNKGQREAINHALTSEDQVIIIAGGAGVGKTTLMQEVKSGIEAGGKKMYAFAPSADASRGVLRDKGFEGAETIKKLLNQENLQQQLKDQVLLIDEAGMIGNQTMNDIFKVAQEQNARVILSGDWKQHTSVEAGDALRLLEKDAELPVSRVEEIVRQQDKSAYKQAVKNLSEGKLEAAYQTLDKMEAIKEIEEKEERHKQIANDYLDAITASGIKQKEGTYRDRTALVVSPTHAEGKAITEAIRDKMKEKELIEKEEQQFKVYRSLSFTAAEKQDHINYKSGMFVQFYQKHQQFKAGTTHLITGINEAGEVLVQQKGQTLIQSLPLEQSDRFEIFAQEKLSLAKGDLLRITGNGQSQDRQALNNGESYKVKDFTPTGDIVLEDGKVMSKDYKHFNLGYYRTSHSAQGKDADDVFIAQSATSFVASNQKQHYVSVSRGVERCVIYTDDKEALKWAVSKDADRMSADEVLKNSQDHSATFLKSYLLREQEQTALKLQEQSSQKRSETHKEYEHLFKPERSLGATTARDEDYSLGF